MEEGVQLYQYVLLWEYKGKYVPGWTEDKMLEESETSEKEDWTMCTRHRTGYQMLKRGRGRSAFGSLERRAFR